MVFTDNEKKILEMLFERMSMGLPDKINISAYAVAAGIRERRLRVAFKQQYGMTLRYYEWKLTMEYAARNLREGMQVKALSILLGYKNSWTFSRSFHKYHGKLPRHMR